MVNKTESKWKWVARMCEERGYEVAAELAIEIDDVLFELYGTGSTSDWENHYTNACLESGVTTDEDIFDVCKEPRFCVGCVVSGDRPCDTCKFGSKAGICDTRGSLFGQFVREFKRVEGYY